MKIDLKTSVRDQMILHTEERIRFLLSEGIEQLSVSEMGSMLGAIGLRLDFNPNNYCLYYYNNLNPDFKYYECTTHPIDKGGHSAYNIYGGFYKELGDFPSEKGLELRRLRNQYFCVKRYRGIDYIVSF